MTAQRRVHWSVLSLLFILALALVPGCGSDDDGGPSTPPEPTPVAGRVVKGPVSAASVTLNAIVDAETPGAVIAGPFTTDADGAWSGELPAGASGPFLIVATGGEYTDEASGETVALGAAQLLGYSNDGSGTVSPYTHALAAAAAGLDGSPAQAWASALAAFENAFGFDPTTTDPELGAGADNDAYFALLGGLSHLLDSNSALDPLASAAVIDLVLALARDLADGVLDGLDADGSPIVVAVGGGTLNWPVLDAAGIQALIDAINAWASTVDGLEDFNLDPVDLDFDPPTTGTGSGSVTFSGPGASVLSSTVFEPLGFSTNQQALAWASGGIGTGATIGVSRSLDDPTRAVLVSVTIVEGQSSYGWSVFEFEGSVPGVSMNGNTVTFTNVTVPAIVGTTQPLTLNGTLGE